MFNPEVLVTWCGRLSLVQGWSSTQNISWRWGDSMVCPSMTWVLTSEKYSEDVFRAIRTYLPLVNMNSCHSKDALFLLYCERKSGENFSLIGITSSRNIRSGYRILHDVSRISEDVPGTSLSHSILDGGDDVRFCPTSITLEFCHSQNGMGVISGRHAPVHVLRYAL